MRVLMSAYAIRPGGGSEPGIGWNWAVQAARFNDVWVLTPQRNQHTIEAGLAQTRIPRLHFAYHDAPHFPGVRRLGERGRYHWWQWTALSTARRLHREIGFDVAQHITFGGVRYPTFLSRLGVPYVLGPVGGIERGPRSFYPSFGLQGAAFEVLRDLTGEALALNPWVRQSLRNAARILVTSEQTRQALPSWAREKARVMSALGIDVLDPTSTERREPFSILYAGRLLPWKGLSFAIQAFAEFHRRSPDAVFTIAGAGPDLQRLQKLALDSGVADQVRFTGQLPFSELTGLYRTHHAFMFPCFHLSGLAVLEAMNAGLPVITLDLGDAAESVTAETGIRVLVRSPRQVVKDLADALDTLNGDRDLLARMSEAGRAHIAAVYQWDKKGEVIRNLYTDLAGAQTRQVGRHRM